MATPEHAPHIPHIPVPDIKGAGRWALTHWKPVGLTLATFAGGTYLALPQDRGPQTPPQDQTKASDTFKPPEGGPGIVIPPQSPDNPSVAPSSGTGPEPGPKQPETKKCSVLADCSKVEFFVKPNVFGVDVLYAGANLEPGTLLFARRDGQRGAIDLDASSSFKRYQHNSTRP